jgi:hypothetical protein
MTDFGRLTKLRTMSLAEIGSRMGDHLCIAWERQQVRRRRDPETALRERLVPALTHGSDWRAALLSASRSQPPGLFPSLRQQPALAAMLTSEFPAGTARAVLRARRAVNHEVDLFGRAWALGDPIDWHRAPGHDASWPLEYYADLELAGHEGTRGDVKEVWELNRHQFLIDLAKAWLLERDQAYLDAIRRIVTSWIATNPVGMGVNWAGPLEVAYRALSWTWAYGLVRDSLDDATHLAWLGSFGDHGRFLHRHLELYSSPYNHLIGEAAVLYMLGVLFPQFRAADRWRQKGRRILESRLSMQFYQDGGSAEQATVYHHATLGYALLAALAGRFAGEEFAPHVWLTLERATAFSMLMTQPDGRQAAWGDNDDAWPVLFDRTDGWDYRHFLSTGAVLFGRGDFKLVAGRAFEETAWLLGPEAVAQFSAIPTRQPDRTSAVLPSSGYVQLRTDWTADADYASFDCGEQAGGLRTDGVPSSAHGHADCLSVLAGFGGEPVLVDGGYYAYNVERPWERFFRETAAHNTVCVDNRDQAVHLEKLTWTHVPVATREAVGLSGDSLWACASHDGYARTTDGIVHRRTVWLRRGYVVIADELEGRGSHAADVVFQFAPTLLATLHNRWLGAGERYQLHWISTASCAPALYRGGQHPHEGWVAPALFSRVAASRLALTLRFSDPGAVVLSVLIDGARWHVDRGAESGLLEVCLRSRLGLGTEEIAYAVRSELTAPSSRLTINGRAPSREAGSPAASAS